MQPWLSVLKHKAFTGLMLFVMSTGFIAMNATDAKELNVSTEQKAFNIDRIDLKVARTIDLEEADAVWNSIMDKTDAYEGDEIIDSSKDNSQNRDLVYVRSVCTPEVMSASNLLLERMNHLNYHFPGDLSIVVLDDKGLVALQNTDNFPLVGTMKLQLSYAVISKMNEKDQGTMDSITVSREDLKSSLFSPLYDRIITCGYADLHSREKPVIPPENYHFSLGDLLYYSVGISDNNATDILLNEYLGGPAKLEEFLQKKGLTHTYIKASQADIAKDVNLNYLNSAPAYEIAKGFATYIQDESISKVQRRIIENSLFFTKASQNRIERGVLQALYNKKQYEEFVKMVTEQNALPKSIPHTISRNATNSTASNSTYDEHAYLSYNSCCFNNTLSYRNALVTKTDENKKLLDIDVVTFASGATRIAPDWEPNRYIQSKFTNRDEISEHYVTTELDPAEVENCCGRPFNKEIAENENVEDHAYCNGYANYLHGPQLPPNLSLKNLDQAEVHSTLMPKNEVNTALSHTDLTASLIPNVPQVFDKEADENNTLQKIQVVDNIKDRALGANGADPSVISLDPAKHITNNVTNGHRLSVSATASANAQANASAHGTVPENTSASPTFNIAQSNKAQDQTLSKVLNHALGAKTNNNMNKDEANDKDRPYLTYIPRVSYKQNMKELPKDFVLYSRAGIGGVNANGERIALNDLAYLEINGHPYIVAAFTKNIKGDPAASIKSAEKAISDSVEYIFDYISILKRYEN